jgi:hypothetical protein
VPIHLLATILYISASVNLSKGNTAARLEVHTIHRTQCLSKKRLQPLCSTTSNVMFNSQMVAVTSGSTHRGRLFPCCLPPPSLSLLSCCCCCPGRALSSAMILRQSRCSRGLAASTPSGSGGGPAAHPQRCNNSSEKLTFVTSALLLLYQLCLRAESALAKVYQRTA